MRASVEAHVVWWEAGRRRLSLLSTRLFEVLWQGEELSFHVVVSAIPGRWCVGEDMPGLGKRSAGIAVHAGATIGDTGHVWVGWLVASGSRSSGRSSGDKLLVVLESCQWLVRVEKRLVST